MTEFRISIAQLREDKASGLSNKTMAEKYSTTVSVISDALKAAGVSARASRKPRIVLTDAPVNYEPVEIPEPGRDYSTQNEVDTRPLSQPEMNF